MQNHQEFLENTIKASQKNTEMLLEPYFQLINEAISDVELLQSLSKVSNNMLALQSEFDFQIRNAKRHK